jgi:hypothetical protein
LFAKGSPIGDAREGNASKTRNQLDLQKYADRALRMSNINIHRSLIPNLVVARLCRSSKPAISYSICRFSTRRPIDEPLQDPPVTDPARGKPEPKRDPKNPNEKPFREPDRQHPFLEDYHAASREEACNFLIAAGLRINVICAQIQRPPRMMQAMFGSNMDRRSTALPATHYYLHKRRR